MKFPALVSLLVIISILGTAQAPLVKQWDKRFGGTGNDIANALQKTTDGGNIFGGYTDSGMDGDKTQPSWGDNDYWVVKIDSSGNKQWDKRYGGNMGDYLYSLQQTKDGGYILGGRSNSDISGDKTQAPYGSHSPDYWIVKIDSSGNKQWDKRFGGPDTERLISTHQTIEGGYILGGSSYGGIGGDKSQAN